MRIPDNEAKGFELVQTFTHETEGESGTTTAINLVIKWCSDMAGVIHTQVTVL